VRGELVHHCDAGQFTATRLTEHLELEGVAASIGTVGDAYDNSLMIGDVGVSLATPSRQRPKPGILIAWETARRWPRLGAWTEPVGRSTSWSR